MKSLLFIALIIFVSNCANVGNDNCVEGNCQNGEGRREWNDGGYDEGTFVNGQLNGIGKQLFGPESEFAGDTYEGMFKDDRYSGYGEYYDKDMDAKSTGYWKNGHHHGKAQIVFGLQSKWPNRYYDGDWINGKREGFGIRFWGGTDKEHNQDLYEGYWKNDKPHGLGRYTWTDGSYYEGPYMNGEKHGKGKITYPSGEVFEGYWENGYCKELADKLYNGK